MSIPFSHFFTKINHFSPQEHNFTEVLNAIALKPKILYSYGKIPQNMSKISSSSEPQRPCTVAIVGSRHCTKYGEEIAYSLAEQLARNGVIIVSGLAFGIDSVAHRGCLAGGGITLAILGTRIDEIYPKKHLGLAAEIIEKGGAILSEYAPSADASAPLAPGEAGWDGHQWVNYKTEHESASSARAPFIRRHINQHYSFLYRNRLISGLADIVIVVEAAERSGSLNTATHAIEQGKTVFAVPGNINNPYSQGCNKLIRQGAIPYTEPDDILRELFPADFTSRFRRKAKLRLFGDTDAETKILQAVASGLRSGEDIMSVTHLPPEVFNLSVTLLEVKGRLRSLGLNNWSLA